MNKKNRVKKGCLTIMLIYLLVNVFVPKLHAEVVGGSVGEVNNTLAHKTPIEISKQIKDYILENNFKAAAEKMFVLIAYTKYDAYKSGEIGQIWEGGLLEKLLKDDSLPTRLKLNNELYPSIPLERILPESMKEPESSKLKDEIKTIENNPNGLMRLLKTHGRPTYELEYLEKYKTKNLASRHPLDQDSAWAEVLGEYWREYE